MEINANTYAGQKFNVVVSQSQNLMLVDLFAGKQRNQIAKIGVCIVHRLGSQTFAIVGLLSLMRTSNRIGSLTSFRTSSRQRFGCFWHFAIKKKGEMQSQSAKKVMVERSEKCE